MFFSLFFVLFGPFHSVDRSFFFAYLYIIQIFSMKLGNPNNHHQKFCFYNVFRILVVDSVLYFLSTYSGNVYGYAAMETILKLIACENLCS